MDRAGNGFSFGAIKYHPLGPADFVNPNFDIALAVRQDSFSDSPHSTRPGSPLG